jgi:16S rRNA G1207 methylase RsmC
MDQATIGGLKGTELSGRFLSQAVEHLTHNGRVYLVCSTLSDVPKIQRFMETLGFKIRIAATKKLFYEQLHVLEGVL